LKTVNRPNKGKKYRTSEEIPLKKITVSLKHFCLLVIARMADKNTQMPDLFKKVIKIKEMRKVLKQKCAEHCSNIQPPSVPGFPVYIFILMHLGIECFQLNICRKI
jgi:hypothetical protein